MPNSPALRQSPSLFKTVLAFAAAITLGFAISSAVRWFVFTPTPNSSDWGLAVVREASNNNTPAPVASTTAEQERRPAPVAALRIAVITDSGRHDGVEQLAMASGSAFELGLSSDQNGQAEVFAINPEGATSRLWTLRLYAGKNQRTPRLRLQGVRGTETLRVVFKPDSGDQGGNASTVVKQLKILHV